MAPSGPFWSIFAWSASPVQPELARRAQEPPPKMALPREDVLKMASRGFRFALWRWTSGIQNVLNWPRLDPPDLDPHFFHFFVNLVLFLFFWVYFWRHFWVGISDQFRAGLGSHSGLVLSPSWLQFWIPICTLEVHFWDPK